MVVDRDLRFIKLNKKADSVIRAYYPEELIGRTPMDTGVPVLKILDEFVLYDSAAIVHWIGGYLVGQHPHRTIHPVVLAGAIPPQERSDD